MRTINTILACCFVMLLTSCDLIMSKVAHRHTNDALEITSVKFSDDYSKITMHLSVTKEVPGLDIVDSNSVDIKVMDTYCHVTPLIKVSQPKVKSVKYIAPDEIREKGLTVLALVDLTQPAPIMKKQQEYVEKLYSLFSRDNLCLAFMLPDGSMSQLMTATDYIVNNYINDESPLLGGKSSHLFDVATDHVDTLGTLPKKQHAWLYRSVSNMLYNISGHSGTFLDSSRLTSLVIFSDGQVYDEADNLPLDPQHFVMQERLINQSANLPENVSIYYVNLKTGKVSNSVKDSNLMRMLCMRSEGKYMSQFDWITLRNDMLSGFNIKNDDYIVELVNHEGKIYFGNLRDIRMCVYKKGTKTLLAECNSEYRLGSIKSPIIVGNKSYVMVYLSGVLIALLMLIFVYIILQFIVPYVRYRIFRNKYVVNYTGPNMSVQGKLVADTCYFCKAPFQIGDSIVAKCQHTMHEECWDENDQHCPEHGKHCEEGSHYYDPQNIFNPRNGSFIIKWIIFAIIAASVAWALMVTSYHVTIYDALSSICEYLRASKPDILVSSDELEDVTGIMSIAPRMYLLPLFGIYLTPVLTLVFSTLASYHRPLLYRALDVLGRTLIVMLLSLIVFFAEFVTVLVCDTYEGTFLFDWLPWTVVTYLIIFFSTRNTRIHDLHSRTMLCASLAMGIGNAVIWGLVGTLETKNQVTLFILLFIFYALALAITIARKLPVCEKYFLHVNGEVKEMDIALYKWLRQTPEAFVTIGRSVDCQLQISWDATSDIAPVHAIIRQRAGVPYLSSVDGDVIVGNHTIDESRQLRLRHGMSFQIGTTVFTFVEM